MDLSLIIMMIVSLAWTMWFLFRPLKTNNDNLQHSNIEIAKQKLAELKQDLAEQLIDKTQFEQAQTELSQTLAMELEQKNIQTTTGKNSYLTIIFVLIFTPTVAISLYQYLTNEQPDAPKTQPVFSLQQGIEKITQHLDDNPNDFEAWQMLGLSYFELGSLDKSIVAYEKSYQVNPDNPRLLVELASALITKEHNQFSQRSIDLIKHALKLEPSAPDALYLAGMFAVSQQDFELAKGLWNRALNGLPENSEDSAAIQNMLLELSTIEEKEPKYSITVNVKLSNTLTISRQNDFIMIYAKAAQGRPMPIVIQKIKLKDFSGQIVLTDEDAVMPNGTLSSHGEVLVVARVSKTGSAMRQADDIEAVSQAINVKDNPIVKLQLK